MLVVVAVLGMTLMWIYALSGLARREPPDRLDGRAFAEEAEQRCAATRARLDRLPQVTDDSPPAELHAVVDDANGELRDMLADLRRLGPADGDDARLVGLWLDDWDTYLADREDWANKVGRGVVEPFTESDRDGDPISRTVDNFAEVNDMASCEAL
ncbi:hypothetical protein BH18ACT4_BH18ACT4_11520 [soil metagenome]